MKILEVEKFFFEEKEYEIRTYNLAWDITIKVFLGGQPANGYSYSVSLPTAFDLFTVAQSDAVKLLVNKAKQDVIDKAWEKYVVFYISNLKKTPSELIGCHKCGSRKIIFSIVDEREMYECEDCKNIWYSQRKITSPYLCVIDDITEGIEKDGYYETPVVLLLNTAFREDDKKGLSFMDQLTNWSALNKLKYSFIGVGENQKIKFWR